MRAAVLLLALTAAAPAQWTLQPSPTTADLRGIDNVGNGIAWASGTNGTILRTTDSGLHWRLCTVPPNAEHLDFRGIQAFDATTAIAMSSGPGDQSRLYKTTDACQTWTLLFTNPDPGGLFVDLAIVPQVTRKAPRELLLLGNPVKEHFVLWRVKVDRKRGQTPKRLSSLARSKQHATAFAASNSTLFVYGSGYMFLFGTGGPYGGRMLQKSYGPCPCFYVSSRVPVGSHSESSGVFSIGFAPKKPKKQSWVHRTWKVYPTNWLSHINGVAVGGDSLKPVDHTTVAAYSKDYGMDWSPAETQPHGYRSAVAYDTPTKTWITVGSNGTDISSDDGRNWRPLTPSKDDSPDADRNWNALSLPYVVGPHGRIGILNSSALQAVPAKP